MINWQFYPRSDYPTNKLLQIIKIFEEVSSDIDSSAKKLSSNEVLRCLRPKLEGICFTVEGGKKTSQKVNVPVLFGKNGKLEKYFDADAYSGSEGIVIEIEAGRAVINYQFLKDLFQACVMKDVKFLVIAVRNIYRRNNDFQTISYFFDALYSSQRMQLPLKGILLMGY